MAESPQPENDILPPWGCNICFEESREPVCTSCGHLFCWPCLYTWVHHMRKRACPVCRAPVTMDANVVPVYGGTRAPTSSTTTPPRPHAGTRPAPSARAQPNITSAETHVPRDDMSVRRLFQSTDPAPSSAEMQVRRDDLNSRHLYRTTPHPARRSVPSEARAQSAESHVSRDNVNLVHQYRETIGRVQLEQARERAWIARVEAENVEDVNLVEADDRILSRLRRELNDLRRRNATSSAGPAFSDRQMGQLHRSRDVHLRRRLMNAILGRRVRPR